MATYFKYVMDIYFEELGNKYNYDKYLLQQLWDESNTVMKNMLYNYVENEYSGINDEKTNSKICSHETKRKGNTIKCTNKVAGPNRKTCYRHTPELQTIVKKKNISIATPQTCTFIPQKGKFKGTTCGTETNGGTLCIKHLETNS